MATGIGPNDRGKQKVDEGSNQNSSGINFEDLQDIDIIDYMQSYGGQAFQDDGPDGSEDDDYIPEVDDEDYDAYGIDDDDEWLEGVEREDGGLQTEVGIGTSSQGSILESKDEFADLEDNENMFREVD
ncbi:uncharacterized protein LOC112194646 [Rosa chinensis]|uniref:uncharacterized protein LOC112194646 n=1 Tax=Rosa chinensis TaxID=74649 RepID=UPI000D09065F|nr:uncharacterized protein LOC112194646 [Rosa chinensis]